MELEKIKRLLEEHKEVVLSLPSKVERLDAIIGILGRAFPAVSVASVVRGPVFNMGTVCDYHDSQIIIDALAELRNMPGEGSFIGICGGDDLAEILDYIQTFIA